MFTTWAVLKQKMLDDLAAGNTAHGAYTDPSGARLEYKSFLDWQRLYTFVDRQAKDEAGSGGPRILTGRPSR